MTPPDWAPIVAEWGEAASRCPHRVEYRSGCCGGTVRRCDGGRRPRQILKSIRECAECYASLGPVEIGERTMQRAPEGSIVVVLAYERIDIECDESLRALEKMGVEVQRRWSNSAIDINRSCAATDAVHAGRPAILFVDSDIKFDPRAAVHLLARPEPVVHIPYAKKGEQNYACNFMPGIREINFGDPAQPLVPTEYAPGGFLKISADFLRRMARELPLPKVNTGFGGPGWWPFFEPKQLPNPANGTIHYLEPDWAFSWRVRQMGETVWADCLHRLEHIGRFGYSWEEVGIPWGERTPRFATFKHRYT